MSYVVGISSPSKVKKYLLFFLSRRGERGHVFAVFFAPFPEKGILDFIAHRLVIQVFAVPAKETIYLCYQEYTCSCNGSGWHRYWYWNDHYHRNEREILDAALEPGLGSFHTLAAVSVPLQSMMVILDATRVDF